MHNNTVCPNVPNNNKISVMPIAKFNLRKGTEDVFVIQMIQKSQEPRKTYHLRGSY